MKAHIVFDCDGTLIDTSNYRYVLYPGMRELLQSLHSEYSLYVWTARDRLSTLRILKDQGVFSLFESLCTVDDALPKPHASGLELLVGGHSKKQVCVIGDSLNDIVGAKNYGVSSIVAGWNKEIRYDLLMGLGASFVATTPEQCGEWIRSHLAVI